MSVLSLVGGRANLMKVASIHEGLVHSDIAHQIVDTGVYLKPYGPNSFKDLLLPKPLAILEECTSNGSAFSDDIKCVATQLRQLFARSAPNLILVYGDLYPGVGAVIAAHSTGVAVGHVEAGLRNNDLHDTEELNRIIIDRFSTYLFASSEVVKQSLCEEGFREEKVFVVGNPIVSTLKRFLDCANTELLTALCLPPKQFALVTIHREENVNSRKKMRQIVAALEHTALKVPLLLIQYAGTKRALAEYGLSSRINSNANITTVDTVPYLSYLGLLRNARFVITDSSSIQDEARFLRIPFAVCRESNHRDQMTKESLAGTRTRSIVKRVEEILSNHVLPPAVPPEWNLDAGSEIAKIIRLCS